SLHYGPDYKAAKGDSSPSFFAAGPYLSALFGFNYFNSNNKERLAGVRLFYTPLFAKNRTAGTVLGAALEAHFDFNE
ncbi:MAG TPA: hypothetical protein VKS21_08590, partial [Spirochaetota bacterium]|nr:hypothetical protein [Spirochaetota bacterium]